MLPSSVDPATNVFESLGIFVKLATLISILFLRLFLNQLLCYHDQILDFRVQNNFCEITTRKHEFKKTLCNWFKTLDLKITTHIWYGI